MPTESAATGLAFLTSVFGKKLESDFLILWKLQNKQSSFFTSLETAAEFAAGQTDLYVGCCLGSRDCGPTKRFKEQDVVAVPGLWCDIDVQGPAHKSTALPATIDAAQEFIDSLGVRPTLIVNSGFGLQAWWLLDEPLRLGHLGLLARSEVKRESQAFQELIIAAGKIRGWRVDSVGDLARILRLPGTLNGKAGSPVEVRLLDAAGQRYGSLREIVETGTARRFSEWTQLDGELASVPAGGGNGKYKPKTAVEVNREVEPAIDKPEAKPVEHWERINAGVSEGERNNDMASLAGKLLRRVDVFSVEEIKWEFDNVFRTQNERNKPRLPDNELSTIWKSIVQKEKKRRSEEGHENAVKGMATTDHNEKPWSLVTIDSKPKRYLLYSKKWEGTVELNIDQLMNWFKLRLAAGEQKGVNLEKSFAKIWEQSTMKYESLLTIVLRESVHLPASPDENVDARLATAIIASLVGATRRPVSSTTRESPSRLDDDSVVFGFRWLVADLNRNGVARIGEDLVAKILAMVDCGDMRITNVRFKIMTSENFKKLNFISENLPLPSGRCHLDSREVTHLKSYEVTT